jgi:hypothetical protein
VKRVCGRIILSMTADYMRRRFPVTCGTGLADRLTAACGNRMLRFLRYPD